MRSRASTLHCAFLLLLVLLFVASLCFGSVSVGWADLWALFSGVPEPMADLLREIRLPRALCAAVIGAHLALAGLIMQIVLRNPLADPMIFGISGGAALAVVCAMAIAVALAPDAGGVSASVVFLPMKVVPPIALAGGLAAAALVVWLAWDNGLTRMRVLLFGAVLAVLLSGLVMVVVLSLSESRTELALIWLSGSLYARGMDHLWPVLPWSIAGIGATIWLFPVLSVSRFDCLTAQAVGVNTNFAIPALLAVATGFAASAVSVAGPVGFVGLLVPHLARMVYGGDLRDLLPGSAVIGACLVVAGDLVGRIAASPLEIPVGIVTSLLGAPVLAAMIRVRAGRGAQ